MNLFGLLKDYWLARTKMTLILTFNQKFKRKKGWVKVQTQRRLSTKLGWDNRHSLTYVKGILMQGNW